MQSRRLPQNRAADDTNANRYFGRVERVSPRKFVLAVLVLI